MTVLVTGSSGFLGRHLCNALSKVGHEVHGLDKVKGATPVDEFIHRDLCSLKNGEEWLKRYKYIYHLAAETKLLAGNNWRKNSTHHYQVNAEATYYLLKNSIPEKFIFASTAALYGEGGGLHEYAPIRCCNAYGYTKAIAETIIQASSVPYVMYRPGTIVGPYGRSYMNRLVYECVNGIESLVFNNGKNVRSFIDVADVVNAFLVAPTLEGTYNLSGTENTDFQHVLEVIQETGAEHGYSFRFKKTSYTPNGLARHISLNAGKLMKTGKWKPTYKVKDMVENLFSFYTNKATTTEPPRWCE